jgi:two-component system CheB/CheR fusion protein
MKKDDDIKLHVKPLVHPRFKDSPWLVITFEEVGFSDQEASEHVEIDRNSEQRIADLENELQDTRETLQAALEEVETSNEEMQSTNEELLASNEELQSTNEELQAVNEELVTVNAEHHCRGRPVCLPSYVSALLCVCPPKQGRTHRFAPTEYGW